MAAVSDEQEQKQEKRRGKAAPSAAGATAPRRLVVIDGANAIFRAFFAIPNLRASDGSPTNAVYGFVTMLAKLLRDESPDLVAVAMDPPGGSFRKRIYSEYKANRDATPEDLSSQFPLVREAIAAFRVPVLEVEDFEADDVIATLVAQAPPDVEISIISTDKDLMQLVSDRVRLVDSVKGRIYTPADVEARFGVPPEQMLDLRALVGDPSDNIPGVKGIGVKGAAKLIGQWGNLENLLENAADVSAKRAREALIERRDDALLSKELSTLRGDVPLPHSIEELVNSGPDTEQLRELYKRLGFSRLLDALDAPAATDVAPTTATSAIETEVIESVDGLRALLKRVQTDAASDECLCLHLVREEGSAMASRPIGLGLALGDDHAAYVPLLGDDLVADRGVSPDALWENLEALWPGDGSGRAWAGIETKEFRSLADRAGGELPTPSGPSSPPACSAPSTAAGKK